MDATRKPDQGPDGPIAEKPFVCGKDGCTRRFSTEQGRRHHRGEVHCSQRRKEQRERYRAKARLEDEDDLLPGDTFDRTTDPDYFR